MTLLQEIEQGAASADMPLSTLLRKCLILASRLGSRPATEWVEWELNGYPINVTLPEYRYLPLIIKANLVDLAKQVTDWAVPPKFLGKNADRITRLPYRNSIGTIEHFLKSAQSKACFQIGDLPLYLAAQKFTHMEITSAWGETNSGQLMGIVETVRNRVLKFALDLEIEYPNAGNIGKIARGTAKVDQIFVNNIYGTANVIAMASNSNITLNISKYDVASLRKTLLESDVAATDLNELENALKAEPDASPSAYGPKVAAWLGRMMSKAADGTWKMATGAAGAFLGKALEKYYGLS